MPSPQPRHVGASARRRSPSPAWLHAPGRRPPSPGVRDHCLAPARTGGSALAGGRYMHLFPELPALGARRD